MNEPANATDTTTTDPRTETDQVANVHAGEALGHLRAGALPLAGEELGDLLATLDAATNGWASFAVSLDRALRHLRRAGRLAMVRPDAAAKSLARARAELNAAMPDADDCDDVTGEAGRIIEATIKAALDARRTLLPTSTTPTA